MEIQYVMSHNRKSEPSKETSEDSSKEPSGTSEAEKSETPVIDPSDVPVKTGDSSMAMMIVMMVIITSGFIVLCFRIRRKN